MRNTFCASHRLANPPICGRRGAGPFRDERSTRPSRDRLDADARPTRPVPGLIPRETYARNSRGRNVRVEQCASRSTPPPVSASTIPWFASVRFSPTGPQPASSIASRRRAHPPRCDERSSCPRPLRGGTRAAPPSGRSRTTAEFRGTRSATAAGSPLFDRGKCPSSWRRSTRFLSPEDRSEIWTDRRNKPVRCIHVP